jgi:WD40 repeat protein/hemolysin type calcium-binding protein
MRGVGQMRFRFLAVSVAVLATLLVIAGAQAAFPGNNGVLAYTCGANVCVVPSGGGSGSTLVSNGADPSWSSDASQLAYTRGSDGIHVVDVDASGATASNDLVLGTGAGATQPSWSPDGFKVAYTRAANTDIYTINSDTSGGAIDLTGSSSATDADPAWSPDGSEVAFASNRDDGTHFDIYVVNVSTNSITRLTTQSSGNDRHPSWSPDGSTIVFSTTRGGVAQPVLYTLLRSSPSSSQSALGGGSGIPGDDPAYSPDGTKIAYVNSAGAVATTSSSGSGTTSIVGSASQPDWQPLVTSSGGGTVPVSNVGWPYAASPPTVTLPFGDAEPSVGKSVFAGIGTWGGETPITFKYQWKKCDTTGIQSCFDIPGATSSVYFVTADTYKFALRVQVTGTNSIGTAVDQSVPTPPVRMDPPRLGDTPPITGQNVVGQTLSVGQGFWTGGPPITFTYQWRRCDAFGNLESCVPIPGATSNSYQLTVADLDKTLRAYITGSNAAGSETIFTNHTFPTLPAPRFKPSPNGTPLLTGEARNGSTLVLVPTSWTGEAPITVTYIWLRCDATGDDCATLSRVGSVLKYKLTKADVGSTIQVAILAKNAVGSTQVRTEPSDAVAAVPLALVRGRTLIGTADADYLAGGGGNDRVLGRAGNDTLIGGAGDDDLEGGDGNDIIDGGSGVDKVTAGDGSDTIRASDGAVDSIDCGDGKDRVVADAFDKIGRDCEQVVTREPTARVR